jgi:hypothetical protein
MYKYLLKLSKFMAEKQGNKFKVSFTEKKIVKKNFIVL